MGAAENAALVRRYFEAVREDPRQTAALYAPEAVLHYVARHALGGAWQGREAIQDLFRRSAQAFGGRQRLDLVDVLASEARAVAILDGSVARQQAAVRWQRTVVFALAGGVIEEQWIYDDDPDLLEELVGRQG